MNNSKESKNKNSGYVGNRMSKNAFHAHKMNQFTLSQVNAKLLRKYNFTYSVEFFKWLCKKGYIKPIAHHHTGVACKSTCFYSPRTISYVADKYNLSLLYDIYRSRVSIEEAKKNLNITYAKIRIPASLLGIKTTAVITIDVIKYQDIFFLSKNKWIRLEENQFQIIEEWEERPSNQKKWYNPNSSTIIRRILLFKRVEDIFKMNREYTGILISSNIASKGNGKL